MKKGFTLIELPVAIAISAILLLAIFFFSNSSIKLFERSRDTALSTKCVRFIIQRICEDIIESKGALTASNSNKLVLTNITYEFKNGMLNRMEGNDSYNLTINGEIRELKFYYPSNKLIKVKILPKNGKEYEVNVYARN